MMLLLLMMMMTTMTLLLEALIDLLQLNLANATS